MCGRFHIDLHHRDVGKIISDISEEQRVQLNFGDIYPNSAVPILTAEETLVAKWGFGRFDGKGVLINARAETVTQRQSFRKSFLERRCLVPANGFYEWDSAKNKFYFRRRDENLLYLCGFFRKEENEFRFILLTKEATPPVSSRHNRIPVIADRSAKRMYLTDMYFASEFIDEDNQIPLQCTPSTV